MNFPTNPNNNNNNIYNSNDKNNSQNDQTIQLSNITNSSDGNSVDIRNFIADNDIKNTIHRISTSNDLAIIGECSEQHTNFKGIINKRINNLKMVMGFCSQNNISSALNAINIMKDQTVTNDFLHYYINKNDMQKISLTLDNVVSLLPQVKVQLNSKYDVYQVTALKSAKILLNCISERIISVKTMPIGSGVDLAREERVNKCNDIIALFDQIKDCQNLEKIINCTNEELRKLAVEFGDQLSFFLKTCQK